MAKILLVDDDLDSAANAADFLIYEKHSIEMAHTGQDGWEKASTGQYDLLILDWDLPGLNGITILKRFRNAGGTAPVIILTGHGSLSDKEHGLDSGADDYLTKPFELEELAARVRALLRRMQSQKPVNKPLGTGNEKVLAVAGLAGTSLAARYEFLEVLGEGGSAVVFQARHPVMDKLMAVKMLHAESLTDEMVERFKQEAKVISRLEHPNIITIHDFGVTENGQPFMVMDYVEGMSLEDLIVQEGALPVPFALDLMIAVADAIALAHSINILHRDIKPANIMLRCFTDRQPVPKLLDFGLAKLLDVQNREMAKLTKFGQTFGSPPYMSPEQIESGPLDERTDVYSLGCVFYEMLTGLPPHWGDSVTAILTKHLTEPVTPLNQLRPELEFPPGIEPVVIKMLEKSPDNRFQSMLALKQELERLRASLR